MDKGTQNIINDDLTPANAESKGYRLVSEVPDLLKLLNEILIIAAENGYALGRSENKGKICLYQKFNVN